MDTINRIIFAVCYPLSMLSEDVRGVLDVWDSAQIKLDQKKSRNAKTKMSIRRFGDECDDKTVSLNVTSSSVINLFSNTN